MMGHGMAKNLLAKGFALTFKANRNRANLQDLLAAGAKEAKTNAECARASDIVFICVTGSPQVEEIVYGEDGLLDAARPGPAGGRHVHGRAGVDREDPRRPRGPGRRS